MAEQDFTPLFRAEDVQLLADRLSGETWQVLHSPPFQRGLEDLQRGRVGGEANTREKIVEPVLYEVLGYDRNENDAEHAIHHAGAGGKTGSVEYFFRINGGGLPIEAKSWQKPLDKKDASGRSPVRQGFDYAVLSNLRWFIVTNGDQWRLYKTQLKGSQSPLGACERYFLKDVLENRKAFQRFLATFGRQAFLPDREGISRLDLLRQKNEGWQEAIGEDLYVKLVESRILFYRAIHPQFPGLPQEKINEAVVKLLFRIMFIRFAEDTPLLPSEFLSREILEQFERDRKWGRSGRLYAYLQRYFAWLDGRDSNAFGIYPYDGALFDPDPVLDAPQLSVEDDLLKGIVKKLSRDGLGRKIDYSQINPRILGNIYEKFLGYVIEIQEGRLDPQADRDTRRKEGSFYTPEPVTKFLVEDSVDRARALAPERKPWELACLDPACGSGHFLVECVNYIAALCEEADDRRSYPQWKRYVTEHCVFGVDKDPIAVMLTKLSLWINSAMKDEPFATIDSHVKCGNSLVCGVDAGFRLADFEKRAYPEKYRDLKKLRKALASLESRAEDGRPLIGALDAVAAHRRLREASARLDDAKSAVAQEFSAKLRGQWASLQGATPFHWEAEFAEVFEDQGGFDVLVGNPPWGADLSGISDYLQSGVFGLARGQYDSYELFMEVALRLLRDRGVFGYIVPDSITLPEHEPLRRMLLENTAVSYLVRAGEGLFPSVYRGAFFVGFVKQAADENHQVRVATMRKDDRKQFEVDSLFDPVKTISEVVQSRGHDRRQAEFAAQPHSEFDIFSTSDDRKITNLIDGRAINWRELTTTGRGVELGKKGEVIQCPFCYRWDSMPARSKDRYQPKECKHCSRQYAVERAAAREIIVAQKAGKQNWRPLLVGESINRYFVASRRWINVGKDGINYKSDKFYKGKRLLVRKTGVGIMATIDDSGAYTNQVVFTWKLRGNLPPTLSQYRLEYLLGVLNSRLMFYRLCAKSGDTEWRSFPYMTQKTIQELPIRAVDFANPREKGLHDEIAERVEKVLAGSGPPTSRDDYEIEKLVMQLYGVTRPMCRRIFEVLNDVQRLRVIREMNVAEPDLLLEALPD
jgi:hypothetical protein